MDTELRSREQKFIQNNSNQTVGYYTCEKRRPLLRYRFLLSAHQIRPPDL